MAFRATNVSRGAATSNFFAPPTSGRWINPPHEWTFTDLLLFPFCVGGPGFISYALYKCYYGPNFSHYQQKNYYPTTVYTKEFMHKYKRLERWRWY